VGSTAAVYAATHRNGKEFAVKMLHPELSLHSEIRARFLREGYAANALKHPGAVTVLDDDVDEDGVAFLVMELLDGETVDNLWRRSGRRLDLDATLVIAHQLLDVLAAAHARGVVHRDIKPANLFLTRSGRLKVLDFGIARLSDASLLGPGGPTQTGMMVGTPAFMAPEQAQGKVSEIDGQTDVWAVGATLFTLVSGHAVHEAGNAQQILLKAATLPAKPLADAARGVPPAIAKIVDRALAYQKAARWPSAGAMANALRDAWVPKGIDPFLTVSPACKPDPSGAVTAQTGALVAAAKGTTGKRYVLASAAAASALVVGLGVTAVVVPPLSAHPKRTAGFGLEIGVPQHDEGPSSELAPAPAMTTAAPSPMVRPPAISSIFAPRSPGAQAPAAKPNARTGAGSAAAGASLKTNTAALNTPIASCNPNFVFDSEGNKHFKPECF
jgi:serine/threonine-protein kinase